jgi:hypothetical protein
MDLPLIALAAMLQQVAQSSQNAPQRIRSTFPWKHKHRIAAQHFQPGLDTRAAEPDASARNGRPGAGR